MRMPALVVLLTGLSAISSQSQPQEGDLIATSSYGGNGYVVYLNPASPQSLTSLVRSTNPASWVRMAANNTDVTVREHVWPPGGTQLVSYVPNGTSRFLVRGACGLSGFELDHDGRWVGVAAGISTSLGSFLGVHEATGAVTTLFTCQYFSATDVAIDRDPGGMPFAVSAIRCNPTTCEWGLVWNDLQGRETWLLPPAGSWGGGIELHPRSGDYILPYYLAKNAGSPCVARVSRAGVVTTLVSFDATAARVTQDDHVWLSGTAGLLQYDLSGNAVVTLVPHRPPGSFGSGIEVYGSRRLVCEQPPAAPHSVTVTVQSRKPGDAHQTFQLACSVARRPGLRFANGEWLDLDVNHPLFALTALNLAPSVFRGFYGTTDARGNATATVSLLGGWPPNLGLTIFVAGVIYDHTGVRTVTNTHWFVAN
ncbi:MAG: hypothetical protein JXQ29_02610 [Planctomycetes bacterium]|nr:hypothetical protein [Planctomycetota bacterium]